MDDYSCKSKKFTANEIWLTPQGQVINKINKQLKIEKQWTSREEKLAATV